MVVLQQLKLSIEESHNANNGYAKGGGEEHFVEHLFLLASDLGLGHAARFCSSYYKLDWCDNRPARPTGSDPLHCNRSQRKAAHNLQARGQTQINCTAGDVSDLPLKWPVPTGQLTKQTSQARPTSAVNLLQSLSPTTGCVTRVSSQQCS